MSQPNTMSFSNGNPARANNKQFEKLRLIDRECEIDWANKQILERETKVSALKAEYAHWFGDSGRFEELRRIPIPDGEVVDYLLTWVEGGVPHAAHHMHVLDVSGGRIVRDTVLCGGRWPASLLAEMQAVQQEEDARARVG